ncbi:MAG: hypothetical protein M5R42_01095 [Rhodocyclaceae bacterium]|nr:hypothetical protein [Rhodocyclaceae bacterium]
MPRRLTIACRNTLLAPSIVFVDLETTGTNPALDRVIRGRHRQGERRTDRVQWSALVDRANPFRR